MVRNRNPQRRSRAWFGKLGWWSLSIVGVSWLQATAQEPIQFRDVTAQTGISFRHTDGGGGQRYIVEYIASGLALFDYDNDGDIDVYFLNGAPLKGTTSENVPRNALYRNDGKLRFTDVTEQAGVGDPGHGLGVTVGDYDNDGDQDLYVNNFGPNVLYRNNGNGTFTNVTGPASVANGDRVGAGVCFLDADKDGFLDLYVSNYVQFSYATHHLHLRQGMPAYPSPLEYKGDPDTLFHNNGNGTFTDISQKSGIAAVGGTGMGMVCCDYDNDGDTDVLVGNDVMANFLFQNDGSGKFSEVGIYAGTAFDVGGIPHGSMGIGCGDYDNDGWLDFFVTSYSREWATLYRNLGNGLFADVTRPSGAGRATYPHVTWGTSMVDFDHDGDRDLFIACGHLEDNIERRDDTTSYRTANILMRNDSNGHFTNVTDAGGDGLQVRKSSRGAGFDDLDNDGDVDIVILNSNDSPTILENVTRSENHWLAVQLQGTRTNRDGVGAQVRLFTGTTCQLDEVHSGCGYQSHFGSRLYFGLGAAEQVDRIEVRWIGGGVESWHNVRANQLVRLVEGQAPKTEETSP